MTVIEGKKRRVLIVSFLFPPVNNMGAVRIGKFAKYLPQFGWEPIVLTVDRVKGQPQTLPVEVDEANIVRTPYFALGPFVRYRLVGDANASSQEIAKGSSWGQRAYRLIRLMRFIYLRPEVSFFINEPWGWYPYALRKGLEVNKSKVDIIFSTFGPRVSHLVASRLRQRTGIPWVAEFRDLWSLNPYFNKSRPFQFLEEQFEKMIMKNNSLLATVSEPLAKELEAFHSRKTIVIPNGFDEEDYTENVPLTPEFTITYTGNIYPGKHDPTPLFQAIAELRQEGRISPDDLEVRFFGSNVAETLSPSIKKYRLQELVRIYGFVPFKESIKKQKESTVQLLLGWNDPRGKGTYTAKIFEYLGAARPVLAIAFKGGEIDRLLARTGGGILATEVGEIKEILLKWVDEFRQYGRISSYYNPNQEIIKHYTRREQARKLAIAFDEVISSTRGSNTD